ncbi:hypothetical protein [Streptomyces sp. KR55]|uniref:hypothetical protein n=1 Tax=Streptomyces sp. KR55 TaxID=3457425 RepID=UPI003FD09ED6
MLGVIVRVLGRIRCFRSPRGRGHAALPGLGLPPRRTAESESAVTAGAGTGLFRSPTAPTVRPWFEPLDGTDNALVRPYLAAHEREEQARIQRLRRDILWCATYGVDLDTRDIHAALGAAS